jgi:hypothetical protein
MKLPYSRIILACATSSIIFFLSASTVFADVDLTKLPLGDGKISDHPELGSVWPCQTETFGTRRSYRGEWIKKDGSFDFANKPSVDGEVMWPHHVSIHLVGDKRRIAGNDLPMHPTGNFPINPSSDVYRYDTNPNSIRARDVLIDLPANPQIAERESCVSFGAVGMLLTGGLLYSALDANGEDAVAHEIQDKARVIHNVMAPIIITI